MNDKIKDLFVACGMSNEELMDILEDKTKSFYIEQFAKLIIKECLFHIQDMDSDDEWDRALRCAKESIKSHFGVKS